MTFDPWLLSFPQVIRARCVGRVCADCHPGVEGSLEEEGPVGEGDISDDAGPCQAVRRAETQTRCHVWGRVSATLEGDTQGGSWAFVKCRRAWRLRCCSIR